jgi:hypothetical protein
LKCSDNEPQKQAVFAGSRQNQLVGKLAGSYLVKNCPVLDFEEVDLENNLEYKILRIH